MSIETPVEAATAADAPERSVPPERGLRWRLGVAAVVLGGTIVAFGGNGQWTDATTAHTLALPIDRWIPFVPASIYVYSWVYTSMLYPLFVVRSSQLFARTAAAYVLVIVASLTTYLAFPVTSLGFRPDVSHLDPNVFHEWGIRLTFFVDPPTNLFPSLHVSIAAISALAAWKARRLFGLVALPLVVGIVVSISTMKQHYVLDGVAALALAGFAYALLLRPYDAADDPAHVGPTAYTWRGPALYVAFHASVYASLYAGFRLGFRPWEMG